MPQGLQPLSDLPRQHLTGEKPFLTFEVVSLVPYDRNLIDVSLLSQEHVWELGQAELRWAHRAGVGTDTEMEMCLPADPVPERLL